MPQNPVDPFAEFEVVEEDPFAEFEIVEPEQIQEQIQLSPEQVADSPSVINNPLRRYFTPMTDIGRRSARSINELIPDQSSGPFGTEFIQPLAEKGIEFLGGAFDEMTSPVNAIPTALSMGSAAPVGAGIKAGLSRLAGIASTPQVLHGVGNMLHPESTMQERLFGGMEAVGGFFGMKGPKAKVQELPVTQVADEVIPKPIHAGAEVQNARINPQTGETIIPGITSEVPIQSTTPKLPRDLAGAKPRFFAGQAGYNPVFESDIDKALYIVAQTNKSKRDADYMKFLVESTGLSPEEIMQEAAKLKTHVKGSIADKEPGDLPISTFWKNPNQPITKLDYSPSMEKKAKELISQHGETNFEGMSNKQIIELAEQVQPGWQSAIKQATADTIDPEKIAPKLSKPGIIKPKVKLVEEGLFEPEGFPGVRLDSNGKVVTLPDEFKAVPETTKRHWAAEALGVPRSIWASWDFSFPFRQGIGAIHHTGDWLRAWPAMVKSFGSDKAFKGVMESIEQKPNFRKRMDFDPKTGAPKLDANGIPVLKPSFAEESGLAITDTLTTREHEWMNNRFANKYPLVARSNRAYTAFANKLRADVFDNLVDDFTKAGLDPRKNVELAKQIATLVNNTTGRGNMPGLEQSAEVLSHILFSPRLAASRINTIGKTATALPIETFNLLKDPRKYLNAPPSVRKEYLKSGLATGAAWGTITGLGSLAGAKVVGDPTNADFGKAKFGQTRIDPSGGFSPFIVLASRLASLQSTGSESGETKNLLEAKGPMDPTVARVVGQFARNKLSPVAGIITDWATQTAKEPFDYSDTASRLFVPIVVQDLLEILNDPKASPFELLTIPATNVGMGANTYGSGRDYKRRMLGGLGQ